MVLLGIDPGKHTGIAVWDCKEQEFLDISEKDFWSTYEHGKKLKASGRKIVAYVEDPSGNSPVWHGNEKPQAVRAKIAQRVGRNKQEAELLMEGLRRAGIPVRPIVPKQQKWDAKTFKNITGYEGQTNSHKRDAARMVFGRKQIPELQYEKMMEELSNYNA